MYARQTAWLNTAPQRPKGDKSQELPLTRLEQERKERKDDKHQPDMPALELGVYLMNYFFEVGPVMAGAAGATALTHGELSAWQANLGIQLEPWECRFLRRLSREYVNEMHRAEKIDAAAPWQPEDYVPDLAGVAQRMRSAIERMAARD